jgi:hypothetical protein
MRKMKITLSSQKMAQPTRAIRQRVKYKKGTNRAAREATQKLGRASSSGQPSAEPSGAKSQPAQDQGAQYRQDDQHQGIRRLPVPVHLLELEADFFEAELFGGLDQGLVRVSSVAGRLGYHVFQVGADLVEQLVLGLLGQIQMLANLLQHLVDG